ncbi:hypothetical protein BGY98DRAFT_914850 [Russula aff. rugulosa BPL654]|nr:hypothetical protein BGY98DRAFT_914850 [Russula aff. rugulosa BPL654]
MYNVVEETPVDTCWRVQCDKCGKTTWKGCGSHVDQVMAGVKEEDRCVCPR